MSFNIRLGFGMARVYGFTPLTIQGAYYPRNLMMVPSREYCVHVLRKFNGTKRKDHP
jgi:hypothetical protein